MAATLFEHPWILLIVAAISLVRWLIQKSKTDGENADTPPAPPPNQPIPRGGETRTEEERIRKFLEALGQPAGSAPPVAPRRRQPEPTIYTRLPPLTTAPPPLPKTRRTTLKRPPPLPAELPARSVTAPSEPDFQVRDVARQTSSEPAPEAPRTAGRPFGGRIKLGTPQDLRTAIVLREIFGPPRSLQPSDLTSG
jgi:hypothetical protein